MSLFFPSTRASSYTRPSRRARLSVERLETRDCPSAPVITSFTAVNTTQRTVQLSGTVQDANPATVQVTFSGVMSGTTSVNAQGNFSFTAQASRLGTVNAVATNSQQQSSAIASAQVTCDAPVITNFLAVYEGNGVWRFQGIVTAPASQGPAGLTVNFGGLATLSGRSTTVNADGTFSIEALLAPGSAGLATAQAVDWWGQTSNVAEAPVG